MPALRIIDGSRANLERAADLALDTNRFAEYARIRNRLEMRAKLRLVWDRDLPGLAEKVRLRERWS